MLLVAARAFVALLVSIIITTNLINTPSLTGAATDQSYADILLVYFVDTRPEVIVVLITTRRTTY